MKTLLLNPVSLTLLTTFSLTAFLLKGPDTKPDRPAEMIPDAVEIRPVTPRALLPSLPDTRPPPGTSSADRSSQEAETRIDPEAERSRSEADLAALEQMRSIPGAAPLIDDIVIYLQGPGSDDFSLDRLPVNRDGLTELNEHSLNDLIQDEVIREKFRVLMQIIMKDATSRS